jgi:DNA-binding transcriptional MerR regulator
MSSAAMSPAPDDERLYRIGEVSRLTALQPFVLRYWEGEFPMLRPVKGPSGRRFYRQEDVDLVLKIKRLLYDEGFTIAGARRHLTEAEGNGSGSPHAENGSGPVAIPAEGPDAQINRKMLLELRDSLRSFLTLLERK